MINNHDKPKIMILGTFHMRYTPDLHRMEFDNLLSNKRQIEIMRVVDSIKSFNPTKVAFEVVKSEENSLNSEFEQFLNGELDLRIDEIHQIGFRIASEQNHKKIYAVDWMESVGNRGIGQVFEWAKKEQPNLFKYIDEKYRSDLPSYIGDRSIYEIIKEYNQTQNIVKQHEMYMAVARIGAGEDYVGIDWLRWWYQRNLIIYANLTKITSEPSDKTLLLIGSAHIHLISQFLEESGMYEVIKATEYLK